MRSFDGDEVASLVVAVCRSGACARGCFGALSEFVVCVGEAGACFELVGVVVFVGAAAEFRRVVRGVVFVGGAAGFGDAVVGVVDVFGAFGAR